MASSFCQAARFELARFGSLALALDFAAARFCFPLDPTPAL
jgi:hypothetical protein